MSWYSGFAPYLSVAKRRLQAHLETEKLAKKGRILAPVPPTGRAIATTFWGVGWCDQLEIHADWTNRLPRGRTYVRNGSVIDLQIGPGVITALVNGSEVYQVKVVIDPLPSAKWAALGADCAGGIDSLVELLQGKLSQGVLRRLCDPYRGLFPLRNEIKVSCSCPDGAWLCKHAAAALYGVGHRLDQQPELLFVLRQVDQQDLVRHAAAAPVVAFAATSGETAAALAEGDLADIFGLDIDWNDAAPAADVSTPAVPAALPPAIVPAPAVAKTPKPAAVAVTHKRPAGRKPAALAAAQTYVLAVLTEYRDSECSVQDLFGWQKGKVRHSVATLNEALLDLQAQHKVEQTAVEDGVAYWAIT